MTIFAEPEKHYISSCYLSALINGDYSSFDYDYNDEGERDRAIEEFDAWVKESRNGRQGHWSSDNDAMEYFLTCEVSGTPGSCVEVKFHPILDNKPEC